MHHTTHSVVMPSAMFCRHVHHGGCRHMRCLPTLTDAALMPFVPFVCSGFTKLRDTDDHAERLEGFYGGQAHACEAQPG